MAYIPRLSTAGMRGSPYWYSSLNTFYPRNGLPNCTCYAYGRWLEIAGGDTSKMAGLLSTSYGTRHGGNWYRASPTLQAGTTNPQLGDIVCWSYPDYRKNGWGHVAVVEQIFPNYITVSASYASGTYFNTEPCYKSNSYKCSWMYPGGSHDYVLRGFIRMGGASGGIVPSINMPTDWVDTIDYIIADGSEEEINNMVLAYVALRDSDPLWTLEAICGVLGNMWRESHLNPGMREIGNHNNGGLVGWTPLTKWSVEANLRHIPWNDGNAQCEWVNSGKYWYGGKLYTDHWIPGRMSIPMSYATYKSSTTYSPEECAKLFMEGYEAPGTPGLAERQAKARYYYDWLTANLPFMTDEIGPKSPFSILNYPCSAYEIKLR